MDKTKKKKARRGKEQEVDSKGFIISTPLNWISESAHLSRKSLHVGVALWYRFGLNRKENPFKMERGILELFDLTAETYNRTLKKMEKEGLVTVERLAGQRPNVSIVLIEAVK